MNKLISFITAGDPTLEKTKEFLDVLTRYSDMVEIGLPFSDPIAEGEVIEAANARALGGGVTADKVFDMLRGARYDKPLVLLTYINPVFVYGCERFFKRCREAGISYAVIPDLPFEERGEVEAYARAGGVRLITMIAPTSLKRVEMLAKNAEGFVYLVSSLGVTGTRTEFAADLKDLAAQIKRVTDTPVYVGFGISTPQQAREIGKIADGVIVGSAFVKIVEKHGGGSAPYLEKFCKELKGV